MGFFVRIINWVFATVFLVANTVFWLPVTFSAMYSFAREKHAFKEAFKKATPPNEMLIITDNHSGGIGRLFLVFPHVMIIMMATKNDTNRDRLILPFLQLESLRLVTLYSIAYYGRHI